MKAIITRYNRRIMMICLSFIIFHSSFSEAQAAGKYDNPDTIVVARDGTGEFRTVDEAIEVCRAFMDYHKVIYIKKGTYKEKLIIPSWLQNIELCGEDAEQTIITYDDHANIKVLLGTAEPRLQAMGTFRTYTLKIEGNDITLKNLTIENNSARLGQAVSLHTEGDRIQVINCRIIGHQDTIYTGVAGTRLWFKHRCGWHKTLVQRLLYLRNDGLHLRPKYRLVRGLHHRKPHQQLCNCSLNTQGSALWICLQQLSPDCCGRCGPGLSGSSLARLRLYALYEL